jgi:hypothetical protein
LQQLHRLTTQCYNQDIAANNMNKSRIFAYRWPAIYALGFFILFACYFSAAFPIGDDAIHLFGFSNHALPQRGGWIANRVVDAFFNRYLFLLFRPIDNFFGGSSFFQSFARYTGFINAAIALCLIALASRIAIDEARVTDVIKASIFACCLSLTLKIMYGDTTHAIAYNLTTLVTVAFVSSLLPIELLFKERPSLEASFPNQKYYFLIIAAYFTAFGLEIFMLFAWSYFLAYYISSFLPQHLQSSRQAWKSIFGFFVRPSRFNLILIVYAGFSATSLLFLLRWSGRTRMNGEVEYTMSRVFGYSIEFARSLASNRIFLFLILAAITVLSYSVYSHLKNNRASISQAGREAEHTNVIQFYRPVVFFLVLNAAYIAILFIAGFKDNTIMVASTSRSLLFLAPLLYINLAISLRCIVLFALDTKAILPFFALGCLLLALSFSFQFLYGIREKSMLSARVAKAFQIAALSSSDIIEVPVCLTPVGHPILPSETGPRYEWYRNSYRDLFRVYYNRTFTKSGPKFITIGSQLKDCNSKP